MLGSVLIHYLSIIASALLALQFHTDDRPAAFIAVLALVGFRLVGVALADVVFERQHSSWLSFLELRLLGLIVYYLGDAYAREDEVVTLLHLLRVWYTVWEGGPVLVLATYAALTAWLAGETIPLYVAAACGILFVSCLTTILATFFQDCKPNIASIAWLIVTLVAFDRHHGGISHHQLSFLEPLCCWRSSGSYNYPSNSPSSGTVLYPHRLGCWAVGA